MSIRDRFEGPAAPAVAPEFSRPVRLGQITPRGLRQKIAATAQERRALAERFALASLDRLEADLAVEQTGRSGLYRVRGSFVADLAQVCVVTTEPAPAHLEETFETTFTTDPELSEAGPLEVDVEAEDPPEPIEGDAIDLGEAVVQQLAVSLDPYPRAPGAEAALPPEADDAEGEPPEEERGRPNPFAVLARLKRE